MNRYPASLANQLSAYGRYGDDQLVHMNSQEVAALDGIAAAFGRELTRNPHTGMKEAFNLFDILPIALNFIPGIGTAASIALSAASGAASAAVDDRNVLEGALLGGVTGALGAGMKGPADVTLDAATKTVAAAPAAAGTQAAAETANVLTANADKAAMLANAPTMQVIPGATDVMSSGFDYTKAAAAPAGAANAASSAAAPGMFGDTFTDILGAGTDADIQNTLAKVWKAENMPFTMMGLQALSTMPSPFESDKGPGRPEYKDIPENFPGVPRQVNPNYDPSLSAFGEQNAFSSGVNYLQPYGYSEGGEVEEKGKSLFDNPFSPGGIMMGGLIPWIVDRVDQKGLGGLNLFSLLQDGFRNDPKNKGQQPMANAPAGNAQVANAPTMPMQGYASGGPVVPGYKGGGRVETQTYSTPPQGMMWAPAQQQRFGRGMKGPAFELVQDPNYRPAQPRNIRPTNMQGLYSGQSPFITGTEYTRIPLPGGQMGAPPQNTMMGSQSQPDSSFEIATPPEGGQQMYNMPTSGGGMGQPPSGGKAGGPGGKLGNSTPDVAPPANDKGPEQPQINPGMQGFAMGGMVDRGMEADDQTVVREAVAAIMGQSPNPDAAIAMFVDRFGEQALQMLMQKVQGGQPMADGRYLEGPGDGLSDSIPAVVDGQQPSALSSGEFVIPADAVSHLGNGDNKSGAKELYGMIDRLRQARTGTSASPPAINQRGIMPA